MAKSFRTTISVPAHLKARMDAIGEPMNWSAVACKAFEAKLAEVITKRGVQDMEDVVSRLRASKRRNEDESLTVGREYGNAWAREDAEAVELQRLETLRTQLNDSEWESHWGSQDCAYSPGERFVFAIDPDQYGERGVALDFWERQKTDGGQFMHLMADGELVRGFAEGALDVWRSVKDKL